MANTKQAVKRNRQNEKRRLRNRSHRSRLRSAIKQVRLAVEQKDAEGAKASLVSAFAQIDSSAGKGIIHRNTAARTKSRLHKAVAGLAA